MKNKLIVCIIVVLIFLVLGFNLIYLNSDVSNWITDYDYLYDTAVEYIKEEVIKNSSFKSNKNYNVFIEYEGFGIEENGDEKYAYMWIAYEEYYTENDQIVSSSQVSLPYKFTFKENNIISYDTPQDNEEYTKSIKTIFPKSLVDTILNYNWDNTKITNEALEYFSSIPVI